MHGLALQQVQALRAVCLLFSPLLLMTAVLAMGTLGGWIFRVTVASTSASVASTGVSSSLSTYPCAVLSYAFGLASPACFDIASNSEEEQRQLLLNVPHSTTTNNNNNNSNMFLHLHSAISTTAAFVQNAADQQQHQGAALLSPSLLSLLVGVIGPCILFLFLQYQIWRGELRLEDEFLGIFRTGSRSRSTHDSSSGGIKNEKRRREILEIRLKDYTHAVQTSDVRPPCPRSRKHSCWECAAGSGENRSICVGDIDAPEQHDFRSCGDCCKSVVLVPTPGQRSAGGGGSTGTSRTWTHDNGPKREVPNLCCICLTDYQSGQEIAWSSNRSCRHVFHKSCLMPWLIKTQHCPVCRQSFLVSSDVH